MSLVLTQSQVRAVDQIAIQQFGIPGIVLMENAGRGCAEWLIAQQIEGFVTIVAGKGNNAGDGFVIARFLHNAGVKVRLLLLFDSNQMPSDAATNWRIVEKMQLPFLIVDPESDFASLTENDWLTTSTWIVDALLGTGLKGEVREPFRSAIQAINAAKKQGAKIFAVDIPSGLHCDTGEVLGTAIHADATATFVATKPGLKTTTGAARSGNISIIDIGVPEAVIKQVLQM